MGKKKGAQDLVMVSKSAAVDKSNQLNQPSSQGHHDSRRLAPSVPGAS